MAKQPANDLQANGAKVALTDFDNDAACLASKDAKFVNGSKLVIGGGCTAQSEAAGFPKEDQVGLRFEGIGFAVASQDQFWADRVCLHR